MSCEETGAFPEEQIAPVGVSEMTLGFLSVDKKIRRFTIFFSSWEIQVTRQTSFSLIKYLRIESCFACEYRVVDTRG